jgi:hypothetical protein
MCKSRTNVHLGKFTVVRRTLFCMRCNFSRWLSAASSQAGHAYVMMLLMSALWRVSLMLVLNRSLLNREYILINVLKALASIISICNLGVTFLSKITLRYFTLFTNGIFRPFNVRWDSGGRRLRESYPSTAISRDSFCRSRSYIATDGQSISKSWCRAPCGAHD